MVYGIAADAVDKYTKTSERPPILSLKAFCHTVVELFGIEYLLSANETDMLIISRINKAIGFPGMAGSIECQHDEWPKCPTGFGGPFQGKEKKPTIVSQGITDGEGCIWFRTILKHESCYISYQDH